jgi:hypothetical protein
MTRLALLALLLLSGCATPRPANVRCMTHYAQGDWISLCLTVEAETPMCPEGANCA